MKSEIVLFHSNDGAVSLDVDVRDETVWLTQAQMVQLFDRDVSVISRHINNVFKEGEVDKKNNLHFLHIANSDRPIAYYSLDVITGRNGRMAKNAIVLPSRPKSLEEMSKTELNAKLERSYKQARSRQGKSVDEVFDTIERKRT